VLGQGKGNLYVVGVERSSHEMYVELWSFCGITTLDELYDPREIIMGILSYMLPNDISGIVTYTNQNKTKMTRQRRRMGKEGG